MHLRYPCFPCFFLCLLFCELGGMEHDLRAGFNKHGDGLRGMEELLLGYQLRKWKEVLFVPRYLR